MKIVLASYGTRGDVEPPVTLGRELLRRGHDVRMAVPPDLVGFAESAGLAAVAYGPEVQAWLDEPSTFWKDVFAKIWRIRDLTRLLRESRVRQTQLWEEASTTLMSLAEGADLVLTGLIYNQAAASAAEYFDIPLATLDLYPVRANGQLLSILPAPLGRFALSAFEWLFWRMGKRDEDAHRRKLGLPKATEPVPRRISRRGSLEIQAYDEVCFPGLAAEWAKWDGRRPFVGALTMELPTEADEDIASWIAAGTPPIFFGFGSIRINSPADTLAMISAACAQLGERALVCAGWSDFSDLAHLKHVKVVRTMNYAAIFPTCRAIVHHGGSGTIAASLRAGVPTLILWTDLLQAILSAHVKRLKVGTARRFSATTQESLIADIRTIVAPAYVARAREVATWMTKPATSVTAAADVVEEFAGSKNAG